jgi:hypothetical protein
MPLSWNLGTLTSWNPLGHSRPVMGLLYLYFNCNLNALYVTHNGTLTWVLNSAGLLISYCKFLGCCNKKWTPEHISGTSINTHKDSWIFNTMEHSPSWQADCFFAYQYIRRLLQTQQFNIFLSHPLSTRFIQSTPRQLRHVFLPVRLCDDFSLLFNLPTHALRSGSLIRTQIMKFLIM